MTAGGVIALIKALGGGGGSSGGGVLVATDTDGTLDKTWQEIHDSTVPFVTMSVSDGQQKYWALVGRVYNNDGTYSVYISENHVYTTDSASGYPTMAPPAP